MLEMLYQPCLLLFYCSYSRPADQHQPSSANLNTVKQVINLTCLIPLQQSCKSKKYNCHAYFPVPTKPVPALMNWPHVSRNLAWGPIFVLGGGFALAEAVQV